MVQSWTTTPKLRWCLKLIQRILSALRAAYNLANKELGLTELMRQLQAYELMINDKVGHFKKTCKEFLTAKGKGGASHCESGMVAWC
ncbi:hypothetical protein TIFTF001_020533 [Ficus carica]|uniref:Uncharacterized protein n=1 Tax=Ficus carica TaxID=3494 RepID=A0AA88ADW9_FICCA|nr:hypothetical protein TIFTF001_020533 [Ficus carica]